jgi:hypothetical protein
MGIMERVLLFDTALLTSLIAPAKVSVLHLNFIFGHSLFYSIYFLLLKGIIIISAVEMLIKARFAVFWRERQGKQAENRN